MRADAGKTELPLNREDLGARVHDLIDRPLPDAVRSATERALLNVTAASIGGSGHHVVDTIVHLARDHGGAGIAPVAGRPERVDIYFSALATGTAARARAVAEPDRAHFSPTAAPFGTLVALCSTHEITGRHALTAFALGCEVVARLGNALLPRHYEAGWDADATCGVIGAAVCGALLLHAESGQVTNAVGIAVSETLGQRRALDFEIGTLHTGKAASNGLIAAVLARQGFTGLSGLDHPDGFFRTFPLADGTAFETLFADLGERWSVLERLDFQPVDEAVLLAKVQRAVEPVLPGSSSTLIEAIRSLEHAASAGAFVDALAPRKGPAVA